MARFLGLPSNATGNLDLSSYTIISSSCSGTSGATTLSATNTSFVAGQRILICQMRGTSTGKREDNIIDSYVAGTITLKYPLENNYTDSGASQAQVVVVPTASTSSGTLNIPTWDGNVGGLFAFAVDSADGTINGSEKGYRKGTVITNVKPGRTGEGTDGVGQIQSSSNNGNGGAGGGGASGTTNGGGGGGGHATVGNNGTGDSGSEGGDAVGDATNDSLFMGGGGGTGGDGTSSGSGGTGGAIVVVYARVAKNSLSISVNGGNGSNGGVGAGGGGGAGGSILIKCIENNGSDLSATGGTGGSGNTGSGGNGSVGRIRVESCTNTTGTESPSSSTSIGGHNYCGILGGMI